MTTIVLSSVIALLVIFALFCAAEIAMLSASKARLNEAARAGDKRALTALDLLKNPDELLASIVVIMNTLNVASSALTTGLLISLFGQVGVAYATIIMSIAVLIFAEALPKSLGSRYPENLALKSAFILALVVRVLRPITRAIAWLNKGILAVFGAHKNNLQGFTESDVRGALNLGLEHGAIAHNQHRMLDAVLDLDDLTVADVMIHRSAICGLDGGTPPRKIPEVLAATKHSRVPVFDGEEDNIIGVLSVRDYLNALAAVPKRDDVQLQPLLREPYYVPSTAPIGHQLLEFLKNRRHLALVVDEFGDLLGLITLEDILEEIVGDIADEHDTQRPAQTDAAVLLERLENGCLVFSGRAVVRDINRDFATELGAELPEDNAVTLAGVMVDALGHLPSQGEAIKLGKLTLTATVKRGHRVEKITINP
jgi:Mg2+/Co2+ transporter CorB